MDRKLSAPLHVDFAITGRCQLRCSYCSAMPLGDPDVPTRRALGVLEELQELGVFSLLLSGGEPTIHHDFHCIVAAACKAVPSVLINTNGLQLAKPGAARKFRDAAPNAVIAISLDSADLDANDHNRGQGGAQALRAIESCHFEGITVCISAVLTERTLGSAATLIQRFFPEIKRFKFFPRVPRNVVDAQRNSGYYAQEVERFYQSLPELLIRFPGVELLTPRGVVGTFENCTKETGKNSTQCVCTTTRLFINSSFDVYPCYYSANKENLIGSCADVSIREIWESESLHALRLRAQKSDLCGPNSLQAIPARYKIIHAQS